MLISIGALAAGCGSSGESNNAAQSPVESIAVAPITTAVIATTDTSNSGGGGSGGIAGAVEAAVEGIDDASTVTCDINRQTLDTATSAYQAINGSLPTSQNDLVVAALIIEPVPGFEITPDGLVQAIAGGPCVGP